MARVIPSLDPLFLHANLTLYFVVRLLVLFYFLEFLSNQSLFVSIIQPLLNCPLRPVSDIALVFSFLACLVNALIDRAITIRRRSFCDICFRRRRTQYPIVQRAKGSNLKNTPPPPKLYLISSFRVCFDVGVDTSSSLCRFVYTLVFLIIQLHSEGYFCYVW